MMIRRIVIVEPKGERINVFSGYSLPRLGSVLLATILRDLGYDARAFFLSRDEIIARELERDTDLVAISTLPAEALQHADYCVLGEGEVSFPRLVEA